MLLSGQGICQEDWWFPAEELITRYERFQDREG